MIGLRIFDNERDALLHTFIKCSAECRPHSLANLTAYMKKTHWEEGWRKS